MRHAQRGREVAHARRMNADVMSRERDDLGLVQRHPVRHAVPESTREERRVLRERRDDVRRRPSAAVLQCLWQIPVIERHERTDADREERVDERVVEVEALLVDPATPARQHARPADGEAVRAEAELAHERDVLSPAVVVIA